MISTNTAQAVGAPTRVRRPLPDVGMKVAVYWNLHKSTFSIQARSGPLYGRVLTHAQWIRLDGPIQFHVIEGGRQRVLKTGHKNVHAYVIGYLAAWASPDGKDLRGVWDDADEDAAEYAMENWDLATYNPRKNTSFVEPITDTPVNGAAMAYLCHSGNGGKPEIYFTGGRL